MGQNSSAYKTSSNIPVLLQELHYIFLGDVGEVSGDSIKKRGMDCDHKYSRPVLKME